MHAFTFSLPTQIVFGPGTETETGKLIAGQGGHRVLVVYGGQSAVRSGLIAKVQASLTQAGLEQDTLWRHPPQSPAVPGPGGRGKGEGDERRFHSGGGRRKRH
ncbi:MAG: iron-containing alcohol dehydrogenase [Oscillospiraceae bacterium]